LTPLFATGTEQQRRQCSRHEGSTIHAHRGSSLRACGFRGTARRAEYTGTRRGSIPPKCIHAHPHAHSIVAPRRARGAEQLLSNPPRVLVGFTERGISVFRGISYGAPTAGRRFTAPLPHSTWTTLRPALDYGSAARKAEASRRRAKTAWSSTCGHPLSTRGGARWSSRSSTRHAIGPCYPPTICLRQLARASLGVPHAGLGSIDHELFWLRTVVARPAPIRGFDSGVARVVLLSWRRPASTKAS
jgi:Carboxylesterase family